jgi:hypothetical protein
MTDLKKNCIRISEKYWFFNPIDLFLKLQLLPNEDMTLDAKLNSIMRSSFIIFIVMMICNYRWSIIFLIISIFLNIIFYYKYQSEYN